MSKLIVQAGDTVREQFAVTVKEHKFKDQNDNRDVLSFQFSSEALSRNGYIVKQDGITFANFKKNPVFLLFHDSYNFPIGKVIEIDKVKGNLYGLVEFATSQNPQASMTYNLFKNGYMNAVSIGATIEEFEIDDDDVMTITKSDLLEVSAVNVPGNAEALKQAMADGKITKDDIKQALRASKRLTNEHNIYTVDGMNKRKADESKVKDSKVDVSTLNKSINELTKGISKMSKKADIKQNKNTKVKDEAKAKSKIKQEAPAVDKKALKLAVKAELKKVQEKADKAKVAKETKDSNEITGIVVDANDEAKNHRELGIAQEYFGALFSGNRNKVQELASKHRDANVQEALSTGSSSGGDLVPSPVYNQLMSALLAFAQIRQYASVFQIPAGGMKVPVKASNTTVSWVAEGGTISASTDADFNGVQLTPRKMVARQPITHELIAASALSLSMTQVLINGIGEQMGVSEDDAFINGQASNNQPEGLGRITFETDQVKTNTATLSGDDVLDTLALLPEQYQANATWISRPSLKTAIRKLKTSNGDYIWTAFGSNQGALQQKPSNTLLDRPYIINANTPQTASKNNLIVGDFRYYAIGDVIGEGLRVNTSEEAGTAWEKDQVEIRVIRSVAGKVGLVEAFARMRLQ